MTIRNQTNSRISNTAHTAVMCSVLFVVAKLSSLAELTR